MCGSQAPALGMSVSGKLIGNALFLFLGERFLGFV